MNWSGPNVIHYGRKSQFGPDQFILVVTISFWSRPNQFGLTKTILDRPKLFWSHRRTRQKCHNPRPKWHSQCVFNDFDFQIFSDHTISNHANSNVLFSSEDPNGYSRNYLEDQELLEKEHFDDIKVAEADQGYINRYNLINRPSGSYNFSEISNCIDFFPFLVAMNVLLIRDFSQKDFNICSLNSL